MFLFQEGQWTFTERGLDEAKVAGSRCLSLSFGFRLHFHYMFVACFHEICFFHVSHFHPFRNWTQRRRHVRRHVRLPASDGLPSVESFENFIFVPITVHVVDASIGIIVGLVTLDLSCLL